MSTICKSRVPVSERKRSLNAFALLPMPWRGSYGIQRPAMRTPSSYSSTSPFCGMTMMAHTPDGPTTMWSISTSPTLTPWNTVKERGSFAWLAEAIPGGELRKTFGG